MKIREKKGLEFSFNWLFAVIIGAVILVLAIYAATKLISTGGTEIGTAAAKEIGILLNPLETGFEEGKTTLLSVNTETRIYNGCDNSSGFGNQFISTSQKSFGKFSQPGFEVGFPNKYIFSGAYEQGKEFYLFSKPFDFPFKVADLIYLISSNKKYCFVNPPANIKQELNLLKQNNLLTGACSENAINVCFGSGTEGSGIGSPDTACNISVKYSQGYVEKNQGKRVYFETDALMYAAIFSDKEIYECQMDRLMSRTKELAGIYERKANLLSQKECNSNLDMGSFKIMLGNYRSSYDLSSLFIKAEEIKWGNEISSCGLW